LTASILTKRFYERDPETTARHLLGKRLIRRLNNTILEGILVETEAYFGLDDPASRAYHGMKTYNRSMWGEPGRTFIYNVHKYWMLNAVAHERGGIGAVLVRAMEPTKGLDIMKRNRNVENPLELTRGPGRLTEALRIDKGLNEIDLTAREGAIQIADNEISFEIGSSHRIGVRRDLSRNLRFFVKGNRFVSR
jgi:DNA-3-methyladenine glycosylase